MKEMMEREDRSKGNGGRNDGKKERKKEKRKDRNLNE
jgi:hypothetical protein